MTETTWAYIGRTKQTNARHPANTVVCATADRPERIRDNAKEIARWVRVGLTIEHVPTAWVRKFLFTQEPYRPDAGVTP